MGDKSLKQTGLFCSSDKADKAKSRPGFWAACLSFSDWLNLLVLATALGITVWSVDDARWITPSPSLIVTFIPSVFAGFILAKARLPSYAAHILALFLGVAVVTGQALYIYAEPDLLSRWLRMADEIQAWWHAASLGAPSPVMVHIAIIFAFLTWLVGYFSAWFLIRSHNPWVAVILGAIIILGNLNFRTSEEHLHFLAFMAAALTLLAVSNYTSYRSRLSGGIKALAGWGPALWVIISLFLIVGTTSFAWDNSGFRVDKIAETARASNPFKAELEMYWKNFFAPAAGQGAPLLVHGNQQDIRFGGSLELSDQVVYVIKTEHKNRWKTQVYDIYDSSGWKTSPADLIRRDPDTGLVSSTFNPGSRLSYILVPQVVTNVIPITGELVSSSIPVILKPLAQQVFEISLFDPSKDSLLPDDLVATAEAARANRSLRRRSDTQVQAMLPNGLKLVHIDRSGSTIQSISVARAETENSAAVAVSSSHPLSLQQEVQLEVIVPEIPTDVELAASPSHYPKTITDRYLQYPDSVPDRVRILAEDITEGLASPYQKAAAIEEYLAQYSYTLTIETPPVGADGVDFFLFDQKAGYCTYFASAMTVLLRAVDVPARMVSGFLPGQYDSATGNYVIRDRDFHAWTEVYFSGYGWVEFDPTPPGAIPGLNEDLAGAFPFVPEDTQPLDPAVESTPDAVGLPIMSGNNIGIISGTAGALASLLFLLVWLFIYRRPPTAVSIYPRMVFLSSLAGIGPEPWQTALEYSEKLSSVLPQQASAIKGAVKVYVKARYSGKSTGFEEDPALLDAWPQLCRALLKRVFRLPQR